MKINEAVAKAMLTNERAFKDISEAQATRIVKAALAEIAREIDEKDEGKVSVPGFASFTVKQVEREKDGEKSARKRVMVRLKVRKSDSDDAGDAADDEADDD
jgi:nucleoid DNA-binding protein